MKAAKFILGVLCWSSLTLTAEDTPIAANSNPPAPTAPPTAAPATPTAPAAPKFVQNRVSVTAPAYNAEITGTTKIEFIAPGLKEAEVKCWKQGEGLGSDSTVANVKLDEEGKGAFDFPAEQYPHGPICVRILAKNDTLKDNCYLVLYNKSGVSWMEGIPKDAPPAAAGLDLVFADDFDKPLSISTKDPKATYFDHKPGGGDFSSLPFSGFDTPKNPFYQVDTYLRIRASEKLKSSGLISSTKGDGTGIKAAIPCYFECRFIAPSAVGTWPAFWIMTDYMTDRLAKTEKTGPDELDIIEGYGGEGPKSPNSPNYMLASHFWNQGAAGKAQKGIYGPVKLREIGGKASWWETPHIYGCKIDEKDTIYYCDNIEVGRHPTGAVSKQHPFFFLINLATGGGWPVNLSRYNGEVDMYVDYVRVYGPPKEAEKKDTEKKPTDTK